MRMPVDHYWECMTVALEWVAACLDGDRRGWDDRREIATDAVAGLKEFRKWPIGELMNMTRRHEFTWQDMDDDYWYFALMEGIGELAGALRRVHKDPPEWELLQIASICMNWLRKREREQEEEA